MNATVLSLAMLLSASAVVWAQSGTAVEFYHLDGQGNVLALTDWTGAVVESHDYDVFGQEVTPQPGTQPRRFTGKERDTETGWDYFGARYYGSKIGRFTTTDPEYSLQANLVDPQRWNKYAYARNNALRYTDPDGKFILEAIIVGAVVYAILASPDIANAPGPRDPTFKSDQSGKLILNAGIGVAVGRGLLGAELASPPDQSDSLDRARSARDARATELGPKRPPERPAAVAGGYNTETGQVATGCSGGGMCAEDRVVDALGGDRSRVKLTEAVRPRPGGPPFSSVPVCERCEAKYGRGAFPSGTQFKSDKPQ